MKMSHSSGLTWSQRVCYGVGHALNDFTASMWFSYLIVYLQLVLGFDSNYAGFVLLIGQVADAIATPLLGYEISKVRGNKMCRKYGKRKLLHLIGTLCVILSFPFIFSVCPGCENSSEKAFTVMLIPFVIIFQIGWAATQVSHLSLIPTITPHETERDLLNIFRYSVDIMADVSTYVIVWCVFDLTRKPAGDHHTITGEYADKFLLIVIIVVGIGTLLSIIFHVGVKEIPGALSDSDDQIEKASILENETKDKQSSEPKTVSWKGWLREVHFYQVGFLYTFSRLFQNMSSVFMPLYLQETLKAKDSFIATIPLVMNVSAFVLSCCLPKFFKMFSKKVTFMAGAAMGIGSCVWVANGNGHAFTNSGIYGVGVLMGSSASVLVICSLSFIHDLIGTSAESGAFVYGCISFCDKLANGIGGMLVQHLHSRSCGHCDWFYRDVMSYALGGTVVIASLMLIMMTPEKLGQRTSVYNGAVIHPSTKASNYKSIETTDEISPLIANVW